MFLVLFSICKEELSCSHTWISCLSHQNFICVACIPDPWHTWLWERCSLKLWKRPSYANIVYLFCQVWNSWTDQSSRTLGDDSIFFCCFYILRCNLSGNIICWILKTFLTSSWGQQIEHKLLPLLLSPNSTNMIVKIFFESLKDKEKWCRRVDSCMILEAGSRWIVGRWLSKLEKVDPKLAERKMRPVLICP